jgi:Flp pilus assembly pilin Flp
MWAAIRREDGQAVTEYALVIGLMAVVAATVLLATGVGQTIADQIGTQFAKLAGL